MSCSASGKDRDEIWEAWCHRNHYRKMCISCNHFPANGPDESEYQKEKARAKGTRAKDDENNVIISQK